MKDLVLKRTEALVSLSFLLCVLMFFFLNAVQAKQKQMLKAVSPFDVNHFNIEVQDTDPDNVLTGNAGISPDYYRIQINKFLSQHSD
jgi:hypothetical protein